MREMQRGDDDDVKAEEKLQPGQGSSGRAPSASAVALTLAIKTGTVSGQQEQRQHHLAGAGVRGDGSNTV